MLDLRTSRGRVVSETYPDALARLWSAIECPHAGDVLVSATPGFEFVDWGGADHVGGGSHGSLHRDDSQGVLLICGFDFSDREQWSLADVTPLILDHFRYRKRMSDEGEAAVARRPAAAHLRVRAGLRHPHNWLQLAKFCAVGGSGYVVNLCVFALCVGLLDLHHLVAATVAFAAAVTNNFWWNRHWTFRAGHGKAGFQAARFFTVSVVAFMLAAMLLELLVSVVGVAELPLRRSRSAQSPH